MTTVFPPPVASPTRLLAFATLAALALAGCATPAIVVGGGATAGVAIAQERSVGDAIDDTTIAVTVDKLWYEHDWKLFANVAQEVHEGRVLITGTVKDPQDRLDAVRLAWRAQGVREVINEIQVTDKGGVVNYARDSWITTQLWTKLTFDETVRAINYSVETVNGTVYLMGIAQDKDELDRVTEYARNIRYVHSVVSHVWLKTDPRRYS
ncbi:MAG: BON domain-containing protein [Alphaproteobacteria bacterium]